MKQVDDAVTPTRERTEPNPAGSSSVLPAEAWDRRSRDAQSGPALACLEHAARYLIFDQMSPNRTYLSGACDAVELLWEAMSEVEAAQVTRERVERLSSVWLPQQILTRVKGNGPPSH